MNQNKIPVPKNLPEDAKLIFKETYSNLMKGFDALEEIKGIKNKSKRIDLAKEIAWTAVKKKFKKKGDTWVRKSD